jgi:16S rRNA (adenine1518-N6/adenine1519-N6)-dimethyltransferase
MSLLEKAKYLLRTHRIHPKKSLGQNFMIEPTFFRSMADRVSLGKSDAVLDIGAGLGFLTRFLAYRCKSVLAVETDKAIASVLREQLAGVSNVQVIEGNVLKTEVPAFNKVVSIPPYNISSHLMLWLFNKQLDSALLILQREFADRLVASVGTEDYGWLTVLTHYHAEVELSEKVPKSAFYPQPEVDSIITCLIPRKHKPFVLENEAAFRRIVQSLFTQRNRKVRNAVLPYLKGTCALPKEKAARTAETLPFHDKRVRELTPENFGALANAIVY